MRMTFFALLLALSAAPAAAAPPAGGPADTVYRFMSALNKNDAKTALALCEASASILDEFPPHEWQGTNTCGRWLDAYVAYDKSRGISNEYVALRRPLHADVTGDRAYTVFPALYTYVQHGARVREPAVFTVALRLTRSGWRITGWAWAKE